MATKQFPFFRLFFILTFSIILSSCGEDSSTEPVITPVSTEPTAHPTQFTASVITDSTVTLTWIDATGTILPERYVILLAEAPAQPASPKDGISPIASTFSKTAPKGVQTLTLTNLKAETKYNITIYPYTGTSSEINYKTDGTIASLSATTLKRVVIPVFILPLKIGNTWEYKTFHIDYAAGTTVDAKKDFTAEVVGDTVIDGTQWFLIRNLATSSIGMSIVQNRPDGLWSRYGAKDVLMFKYPAQGSTSFTRYDKNVVIESTAVKVQVAKGSFTTVHYREGDDSALQLNDYLAPNIGLIKAFTHLTDPTGDVAISIELQNYSLK